MTVTVGSKMIENSVQSKHLLSNYLISNLISQQNIEKIKEKDFRFLSEIKNFFVFEESKEISFSKQNFSSVLVNQCRFDLCFNLFNSWKIENKEEKENQNDKKEISEKEENNEKNSYENNENEGNQNENHNEKARKESDDENQTEKKEISEKEENNEANSNENKYDKKESEERQKETEENEVKNDSVVIKNNKEESERENMNKNEEEKEKSKENDKEENVKNQQNEEENQQYRVQEERNKQNELNNNETNKNSSNKNKENDPTNLDINLQIEENQIKMNEDLYEKVLCLLELMLNYNQKSELIFLKRDGFHIIFYLITNGPTEFITFKLYKKFYEIYLNLTQTELKNQMMNEILLNSTIWSKSRSEDQLQVYIH